MHSDNHYQIPFLCVGVVWVKSNKWLHKKVERIFHA